MNEYLLLNIAVAGICAGVCLLAVSAIVLGRAVTLVYRANRSMAVAAKANLTAHRMYWAALDSARRTGARR